MGFFSSLFDSEKPANNPLGSPARGQAGLAVYHAAIELLVASPALRDQLKTAMQRAFEAPESFYQAGEYVLAERGLRFPQDAPLTPKFVLIDTLIDQQHMAEVDWKEAEEEIRLALNDILAAKGLPLALPEADQYDDPDTFSVLQSIDDEELQPAGYCLAFLDIDSDSYVFTVVPLEQQPAAEALFDQLK